MAGVKGRGFQIVKDEARKNFDEFTKRDGAKVKDFDEILLPQRADERSAGYDFYIPYTVIVPPRQSLLIWTDVKAYMRNDEVLQIYPRSSLAVNKGLTLKNTVGIIDSSYYENESNDGNIGIVLENNTGQGIEINKGDRFAQGIFMKYLTGDDDLTLDRDRKGGFGSSGE